MIEHVPQVLWFLVYIFFWITNTNIVHWLKTEIRYILIEACRNLGKTSES